MKLDYSLIVTLMIVVDLVILIVSGLYLVEMNAKTMKGVWLEDKTLCLKDDIDTENLPKDETLVKVLRSGICNTDIELMNGYYPYTGILGHEFVGEVVDARSKLNGKIVVGEINCVCHECVFCTTNMKRHCSNRTVMGIVNKSGTHAEYLTLPEENLLAVPESVSVQDACFVEPLAAALEIQEQISIQESDKVAVIGDGKLGLLISKTIALTKCNLTVFGHHEEKLSILEDDGISTCVNVSEAEMGTFDIVIECSGNEKAFEQAVSMLRPRGTLVMKSTHEGKTKFNAAAVIVNELTLIGSRCGPFDKALDLLASGQLNLSSLLQYEFPLSNAMEAFQRAQQKEVLKVQLLCDR